MSRILRRPMFRGGPVDSYGTGIASGLDKPKRGLVNEPGGYAGEKSGMDFLRNALLGERFTNPNFKPTSIPLIKNSGFGFMTPERQSPGLIKIGEGISERNPRFDTLGIDQLSKPVTYGGSQEADIKKSDLEMGEGDIDESETLSSDFYETLGVGKVNDKPYVGGQSGSDTAPKIENNLLSNNSILNNQNTANEELTLEEVRDTLGYKKARSRDMSDMLARASASFLGTGGVKEGLAEFMKSEAAAGPGRLEKIEQAAATLDIKDKIAAKRSKEQAEVYKGQIDYKIGATMKAQQTAASLEGKTWIDSLKYVSENLYKGTGKGLDSTSVIEDTLRLKYQKPVKKFTVSSETEIPKLEISEGFSIIVLPDGSRKIYEVIGDSARERKDLQV